MGTNQHVARIYANSVPAPMAGAAKDLPIPIGFLDDLTQATTRQQVLRVYSTWAKLVIGAERCSIALSDDDHHLRITEMFGAKGIARGSRYRIMETAIGAVFLRQEPAYLPTLAEVESPGCQQLAQSGFSSLALAPISTATHRFGVIDAAFSAPSDNPGEVLALLRAIGRCLATQLLVVDQMDDLRVMAITDSLTGARNRRALYDQAAENWTDWRIAKTPFTFVAIDLDHFKRINDTHGHTAGDAVLCAVVQRIKNNSRQGDVIFRLGGEEFGLLMHSVQAGEAIQHAIRLKNVIGKDPVHVGDVRVPVTASFGVAGPVRSDEVFDDIMKRADRALYEAKNSGRNRVVLADMPLSADLPSGGKL